MNFEYVERFLRGLGTFAFTNFVKMLRMHERFLHIYFLCIFFNVFGASLSEHRGSEYCSDFDIVIMREACTIRVRIQNACLHSGIGHRK